MQTDYGALAKAATASAAVSQIWDVMIQARGTAQGWHPITRCREMTW